MSNRRIFRYYTVSTFWTIRNSWRATFWTSWKLDNIISQSLSLVSTNTFTSSRIQRRSDLWCLRLSVSSVTSSKLCLKNCGKLWNVHSENKFMKPLENSWKITQSRGRLSTYSALFHNAFNREVAINLIYIKKLCHTLLISKQDLTSQNFYLFRP